MDLDTFVQNTLRKKRGFLRQNPYNVLQDNSQSREHLMMLVSAVGCSPTVTPNLAVFCRGVGKRDLKENGEIALWVIIRGPSKCEGQY